MASAAAPYLITSSVSTSASSLSHRPSPAPSSSPSPASSTSSEVPRKRKRDEFLTVSVPPTLSQSPPAAATPPSPSSSLVSRNVSVSSNMSAIWLLSSIWETLKGVVGIDPSATEPTQVDETPESPQKRVRVDGSPEDGGSTSGGELDKGESIVPTMQSTSTQISNKETTHLPTNNNRAALKIKAPTSMGGQTPPTQQLPSPLASSSEDEGENIFKKPTTTATTITTTATATAKPIRSSTAKMGPILQPTTSGPLVQTEIPFFAEPLKRRHGARKMLQRALARREAHSYRESNNLPIVSRFPLHLQRREAYRATGRTPVASSRRLSLELGATPVKLRLPQDVWTAMSASRTPRESNTGTPLIRNRAARLLAHRSRVEKRIRESYAQSQQRSQAENESLEALLRQLIADKAEGFHSYEEVARRRQERAEDVRRMREADNKVEKIPLLTPEQAKLVKETITEVNRDNRAGHEKTYITKFKIPIGTRDLLRVPSGNWLNDEVINFYLNMVVDRSRAEHPGEPQRILVHNTFFFPKLVAEGHKAVSRWARRQGAGGKDMLKLDFLFAPVHIGNSHWCLAVANFKMKRIEYYDSLGGNFLPENKPMYFKRMREYVEAETGTGLADWTDYVMPGAPQQTNFDDCGAFVVKTAEVLARGGKMSFGGEDMPLIRDRIMLEVLRGSLLPLEADD